MLGVMTVTVSPGAWFPFSSLGNRTKAVSQPLTEHAGQIWELAVHDLRTLDWLKTNTIDMTPRRSCHGHDVRSMTGRQVRSQLALFDLCGLGMIATDSDPTSIRKDERVRPDWTGEAVIQGTSYVILT